MTKYILKSTALDLFDDFLNECYDPIILLGIEYDYSRVLKEMDEVAYREAYLGWMDSEGYEEGTIEQVDAQEAEESDEDEEDDLCNCGWAHCDEFDRV